MELEILGGEINHNSDSASWDTNIGDSDQQT